MIARIAGDTRIAGDARIAHLCDQRSLRLNGNCPFTFASDPCVNSDPSNRDRKCSISVIAAILASTDFVMETEFHEVRLSRPPSQVISLFLFTSMGIKSISIPFKLLGKASDLCENPNDLTFNTIPECNC